MPRKEHRGRIQAQGGGLEESEAWSQDEPLTKKDGVSLLKKLKSKLSKKDVELRAKPFEQAERFINSAKGGVKSPEKQSFQNKKEKDVRVDIEVLSGTAFLSIGAFALTLAFQWI